MPHCLTKQKGPLMRGLFKGFLLMAAMLLAISALGCGEDNEKTTIQDVKESAKKALDTAVDYSQEQKAKFMKEVGQHWDSLRADIDQLQDKLAKKKEQAGEQAKARWKAIKADLQEKQEAVKQAYEELSDASGEAYAAAKKKLEAAMADLKAAYENAAAELQK